MKTISATKCNTYETCARQFYYTYIVRLLQLDNTNLLMGNAYHDCLEQYHINNGSLTDEERTKIIEKWLPQKTQRELIENCVLRYIKNPVKPTGNYLCEHKFEITIPGLPIPLVGKIDRLDDDKIVEYKTSAFKYKDEHTHTIQSRFYCYVVRQMRGKNLPIVYSVVNKKTQMPPQIIKVQYTDEELDKVPAEIVDIYTRMTTKPFDKCIGIHCRWCSYGESGTNNCK